MYKWRHFPMALARRHLHPSWEKLSRDTPWILWSRATQQLKMQLHLSLELQRQQQLLQILVKDRI